MTARSRLALAALLALAVMPFASAPASASPTITFGQDGKTQPVFDLAQATRERVFIPQPHIDQDGDGVDDKVAIEIIRPKESGPSMKVPAIVDPSPYYTTVCRGIEGECIADTDNDGLNDKWPLFYDNYFVPRGYAMIYAESNGTGNSTGCPLHGGPGDIAGMKSVIDWLNGRVTGVDKNGTAVTASWHNGSSAMIGKSYDGTLTNGVAATGVDGLKTIIPISAISDWYQYSRMGGIRFNTHYPANLSNTITNTSRQPLCAPSRTAMSAAGSDGDGDATGDYNDFWNARNYLPNVGNVKASVFETHGLQDDNVTTAHFAAWWQGLAAAGVPRKLWLLREGHVDPFDSRRAVFVDTLHRWLDHWLLGAPNGIMNEPRVDIEDDKDDWHSYDDWPLPGTQDQSVFLQGTSATAAGVLGLSSGGATDTLSFTNTSQSETTAMNNPTTGAQTARRVFLSPVLTHDMRISGVPRLDLRASLSTTQSNLAALIVDYGAGTHINRSGDGYNTTSTRTCWGQGFGGNTPADGCYLEVTKPTVNVTQWRVTRGIFDSSNRDSLSAGSLVAPDTMYTFPLTMNADDYTFKAGHQIAVIVVGNFSSLGVAGTPNVTITVDTRASRLHLPVVGGYNTALASGAFTADTVGPALNAPSDIEVVTDDPSGAVVTYPAPAATDNEDPAPSASCDPASGTRFAQGATIVTCTARDASGNVTTKTFTVTIARTGDDTPPQGDVPAPPAPVGGAGDGVTGPSPPTGGVTPADSGGPSPTLDTVDHLAPKLAGLQLRAGRHALRLNFKLSEPATVTVTINRRGSKRVLKRVKTKLGKGKRTVTLRSAKLGKGRYTVTLTAVDAAGNTGRISRALTLPR